MIKLQQICLVSFISFFCSTATLPAFDASIETKIAKLTEFAQNLQSSNLIDGEFLIAKGDKILLDLQCEEIASAPDEITQPQFMIGSVSKQFYAVALLKSLYDTSPGETEEEKIAYVYNKLHEPISQFLPPNDDVWSGHMPTWANQVSLHHLLTHTSGIPDYATSEGFGYYNLIDPAKRFFEEPHSSAEVIGLVSNEPLLFPPGSDFAYSNTGFMLIAEVIEKITQTSAAWYLQESLFSPEV